MAIDYGKISVQVTKLYSKYDDIYELWEKEHGKQSDKKTKSCPRSVFIALCELGYIKHIPKNKYSKRNVSESKKHANNLIYLMKANPKVSLSELRKQKSGEQSRASVVYSLFREGLLII